MIPDVRRAAWVYLAPLIVAVQLSGGLDSRIVRVRAALTSGAYAEAEREARELVPIVEARDGPRAIGVAQALDLLVDALIKNGKGGSPAALDAAERAVRLKEQLPGSRPETARSLDNLGRVHAERGEFTAAVARHRRALAIREAQRPVDASAVAASLEALAYALIRLEKLAEAAPLLTRAEALREARAAEDPVSMAGTLELVALLGRHAGDYTSARASLGRALEIRGRLTPGHPDLVGPTELLGDLQWFQGDLAGARNTWENALALAERTLGESHSALVSVLRRLAMSATVVGDHAEASRRLQRARALAEGALAPCHPELAWLLSDVGVSALYSGNYVEARNLQRQVRTTFERCQGPTHANVATAISNEADVAVATGDFAEAERLYERAIAIWSVSLGPTHPYVAKGWDAAAGTFEARGAWARARTLYARALTMRRRALGDTHPTVAWTLTNIARLELKSGNSSVALRNLQKAIDIYAGAGATDEPDHSARALTFRAQVEIRQGEFAAARATVQEALATRERIFGRNYPLVAESRAMLAAVELALGMSGRALQSALDAERTGRDHLKYIIRYLPERQAMAYAAARPKGLDLALSIVAAGAIDDASSVLDSVVQSRGAILDELAARTSTTDTLDPHAGALNATLLGARQRFANLMFRSLQGEDPVSRARLEQARQDSEDAERAMAERSASARADLAHARAGLDDVRRALPADWTLVSFVRYDRTLVVRTPNGSALRTVPSYLAFTIRSDATTVTAIPLGPASAIDLAVSHWRHQASGRGIADASDLREAEAAYRTSGAALRTRIWDPIAKQLGDSSHVLIVPDGALNLVSFAALPTGTRSYLAEQPWTIHYLSAERDVIPIDRPTASGALLAVGGAAFDVRPSQKPSAASAASVRRSGCLALRSFHFDELPGSRDEVADIVRLWSTTRSAAPTLLTGRAATETAVKRAIAGREVIHFATHGFFLGSDCEAAPAGTRSVGGLASARQGGLPPSAAANPLLLSGIALAGANSRVPATASADDGILTAEEVAALNLHGVRWAVLSACDTGVGAVKAGEGVFGLRRAFQIAGAQTVIMSLWSIEDQATRQWMQALYRDRLVAGLNTADAVHDATLSVLRARRARGESTHPFYWGGFVAAGDWR